MRTFIYLLFSLIYLVSCESKEKVIFIKFEHSDGLKVKHDLILKGAKVGEITKVEITSDYKFIATVELSDSLNLPKDSQFWTQNKDLFTKAIFVQEGTSKALLRNGDTLIGITTIDIGSQVACGRPITLRDLINSFLSN